MTSRQSFLIQGVINNSAVILVFCIVGLWKCSTWINVFDCFSSLITPVLFEIIAHSSRPEAIRLFSACRYREHGRVTAAVGNICHINMVILRMSWLISLFLSLCNASSWPTCYCFSSFYSLIIFFFFSMTLLSQFLTPSFVMASPAMTLGLSRSLISPPVQSSACSSSPCSPPWHTDQSWVFQASMTAFKVIPALLFKPWNIHHVQAPVHLYQMGIYAS